MGEAARRPVCIYTGRYWCVVHVLYRRACACLSLVWCVCVGLCFFHFSLFVAVHSEFCGGHRWSEVVRVRRSAFLPSLFVHVFVSCLSFRFVWVLFNLLRVRAGSVNKRFSNEVYALDLGTSAWVYLCACLHRLCVCVFSFGMSHTIQSCGVFCACLHRCLHRYLWLVQLCLCVCAASNQWSAVKPKSGTAPTARAYHSCVVIDQVCVRGRVRECVCENVFVCLNRLCPCVSLCACVCAESANLRWFGRHINDGRRQTTGRRCGQRPASLRHTYARSPSPSLCVYHFQLQRAQTPTSTQMDLEMQALPRG